MLVVLLVLPVVVVTASLPSRVGSFPGIDDYHRASELVYSESGTTAAIEALVSSATREARSIRDPAHRDYWLARLDLLMGIHYNQVEDDRRAERVLERGLDQIGRALEAAGEFSDGLRVRSDLHSQMMFSRGLFYMVRHGDEARDSALRALELDPQNLAARITVAGFYLNAPRMAGGDPAEGLRVLQAASIDAGLRDYERFLLAGFLADAALRLEDPDGARAYIDQAADIYPRSPWVAELRDRLAEAS